MKRSLSMSILRIKHKKQATKICLHMFPYHMYESAKKQNRSFLWSRRSDINYND